MYEYRLNDYRLMYGTMYINRNHKYIDMQKYFDVVSEMEGRAKGGYAMILHAHLSEIICNRPPASRLNISMHISTRSGLITNDQNMEDFLLSTGYLNCNGEYLLKIASYRSWYKVFKCMVKIGLIQITRFKISTMIPIQGRFLPIPYAYVAFLSRLKHDSNLRNAIQQSLIDSPKKMKENYLKMDKEDIIDEIVRVKTRNIPTDKYSDLSGIIFKDISDKYPYKWGRNYEDRENLKNNRENFLENFSEKFLEIFSGNNPGNNEPKDQNEEIELLPEINKISTSKKVISEINKIDKIEEVQNKNIKVEKEIKKLYADRTTDEITEDLKNNININDIEYKRYKKYEISKSKKCTDNKINEIQYPELIQTNWVDLVDSDESSQNKSNDSNNSNNSIDDLHFDLFGTPIELSSNDLDTGKSDDLIINIDGKDILDDLKSNDSNDSNHLRKRNTPSSFFD